MKCIDNVVDLIDELGGTFAVAALFGIGPPAVSNWKEREHIPPGWHLRIYLECKSRNIPVASEVFGLPRGVALDDKSLRRRASASGA